MYGPIMPMCHLLGSGDSCWGKRKDFTVPDRYEVTMRFLDAASTKLMFEFPPDMKEIKVEPNWLNNQTLVHYFDQDWAQVIR